MEQDLRQKAPGILNRVRAFRRPTLPESISLRKAFEISSVVLLFYFVQQFFWPAPIAVLIKGMILGGLTAMVAFGIALIYRANRILNFAQGDLGAAPATLAILLIVGPRWPFLPAMLTGVAAAVVLGIVVETLFVRRFFRAPRMILTVATIFLSILLAGVGLLLPRFFDLTVPPQGYPSPLDFSFEISPVVFRGNDIIAMILIPLAIAALAAFFRFTNVGIAVRASAEHADRAFLLGIPVKRIHTIVWVLATVLATLAMIMRAGVVGLPIGRALGATVLLRALAACVIGRFERLPTIFFAAVGLGMIEHAVTFSTGRGILVDPIMFVVVIVALLAQRRGVTSRAEDQQASSWRAAEEIRPIPRELIHLPEVAWTRRALIVIGAGILLALPLILPESRINLAGVVVIYAIIGISLVVLTGWAGQISLGQIAFVGIGAAVAGSLTSKVGWDLFWALLGAGFAGAFAAIVIGLPALRIRGLFLAVTTFAFALATSSFLLNRAFFEDVLPIGDVLRVPLAGRLSVESEARYYYLAVAGLFFAIFVAKGIRRSRTGRVLIGTRENERAAQAFGVNTTSAKLTAFALSGFLAAFAGGLFIHHQQSLGIQPYAPEESLSAFTMVVIGGLGSVPGAILGALYFRGGLYFMPQAFRFLFTGIGGLLILMVFPGGLGSIFYKLRDTLLRAVASRRNLVVPSLVADVSQLEVGALAAPSSVAEPAPANGATGSNGSNGSNGRRRRAKATSSGKRR